MTLTRRSTLEKSSAIVASVGIGTLAGCIADDTEGEGDYPQETITYLVPAPAGGGMDSYARTLGPEVSESMGVPVQIENNPGGGQWNALGSLATDEANGYTVSAAIIPGAAVNAMVEPPDVDTDDIGFVCGMGVEHSLLVTRPELDQFENDMQAAFDAVEDGEYTQVSVAEGTMEYVLPTLGSFEPIAYGGSAEQTQAVMSGEVPFGVSSEEAALDLVEEGSLVPVGVLSSSRIDTFPNAPALVDDLGYDSIDYASQLVRPLMIHNDTPDDRRDLLEETFEEVIKSDVIQNWSDDTGLDVEYISSEEIVESWNSAFDQLEEFIE